MTKFFTLPPITIPYKYILINANRPDIRYIKKHRKHIIEIIIDSGIEIFRDKRIKDYPGGYRIQQRRIASLYGKISKIVPHTKIYVTIPDYPDDYNPRSLWLAENYTNIERTIDSIIHAIENYDNINWLIPIQGHNSRPSTLITMLNKLREIGFPFNKYDYYAIANLCVEVNCRIIEQSIKYVYYWFKRHNINARIHLFGPKLRCIKNILNYIHSFDSMAWTRPVSTSLRRMYKYSAKNLSQRELFFKEYIKRLRELGVEV